MGAKFSKTNSKGKVNRDDEASSLADEQQGGVAGPLTTTSTLPASFRHKTEVVGGPQVEEEVVSKTDSLPRNLGSNKLERNASFSKRFRKSCKNWARDKGLIEKKEEEEKVEDATEAVVEIEDSTDDKDIVGENKEIMKDGANEELKDDQGEDEILKDDPKENSAIVNVNEIKEITVEDLNEKSDSNELEATLNAEKNEEEVPKEDDKEKAVNTVLEQKIEEDIMEIVSVEPSEGKKAEETDAESMEPLIEVSEVVTASSASSDLAPVIEEEDIAAVSSTPVESLVVDPEVTSAEHHEDEKSNTGEVEKGSTEKEHIDELTAEDAEYKHDESHIKEAVESEPSGDYPDSNKEEAEASENDGVSPIISAFTLQSYVENDTVSGSNPTDLAEDGFHISHSNQINEETAKEIAKKITEEIIEESVEDVEAMKDIIADIVEKASTETEPLSFGSSTTKSQSDDLISEDGSDRVMEDAVSTDEGIEASDDEEQGNDSTPKYSRIESKVNDDPQSVEEVSGEQL